MSTYRITWDCCGDSTETDAWAPSTCPFCELATAIDERRRLRIALADAIRRPMGVIPDSAEGLLRDGDLDRAEVRRLRGNVPFCAPPASWADGQELV